MYRLLNFGWRLMLDQGKLNMGVVIDRPRLASYVIDCAQAHALKAQYERKESCFGNIMGVVGEV